LDGFRKPTALKRFFQSEIGTAVMWVCGALLMAAVLAPWAYQGGKWLAAHAQANELPSLIENLAGSCGRAEIDRFFDRCLLVSALVLLPVLLKRIRRLRSDADTPMDRMARFSWPSVAAQIAIGCVIAGGILWGVGFILDAAGACVPKANPPALGKLLPKIIIPAVAAPLVEEWVFRGLLLGLWLRFARPAAACIGTSLVFAFLHFLKPPDGAVIADPAHALAGFELLGKILLHFTDPLFFVTDFATLSVVGLILAWARVRTGALWFSIGLHAGWVAAFKGFNLLYMDVDGHFLRPWGVGDSLRSGVLPLLALGVTAIVCHFALKRFSRASR
jgi:membrane protease YdiL (CAAX protease family)